MTNDGLRRYELTNRANGVFRVLEEELDGVEEEEEADARDEEERAHVALLEDVAVGDNGRKIISEVPEEVDEEDEHQTEEPDVVLEQRKHDRHRLMRGCDHYFVDVQ